VGFNTKEEIANEKFEVYNDQEITQKKDNGNHSMSAPESEFGNDKIDGDMRETGML
jgi:hypothetical protein